MARRALESQSRGRHSTSAQCIRTLASLAGKGAAAAVAVFAISSVVRNRRHLLVVVSYAGAGVGIAAIGVIAGRLRAGLVSPEPAAALLAVPLVLMFFLALGTRAAFRIPIDIDANWSFKTAPPSVNQATAGAWVAMFVLAVVPIAIAAAVVAFSAGWPPRAAVAVLAGDAASGALLLECLLLDWRIVPFTCAHHPEEQTLKYRWLVYLLPLNIFAFRNAALQLTLLHSWAGPAAYVAVLLALVAIVRLIRRRRGAGQVVEFDPPSALHLEVLNLSEALQ